MARENAAARALRETQAMEDTFRRELPMTLLRLAARMVPFGSATVYPNGDSVRVQFSFDSDHSSDLSLGMETDQWGVQMVENSINELESLAEEAKRLTLVARGAWDALTEDQRNALGLKYRP